VVERAATLSALRASVNGNVQGEGSAWPAPVGDGNIVQGSKEDQCRSL
jgi:hypothetical protein